MKTRKSFKVNREAAIKIAMNTNGVSREVAERYTNSELRDVLRLLKLKANFNPIITMKRTDLSIIMRTAWQMCRATGVTFAECLHKAWQVFKLKIKMRAGIVQFFYLKSSTGELRQAFGTLKDDLCPETKGDDRKPNKHLVTYYDTVAEGWRSFRMFNFVKVI